MHELGLMKGALETALAEAQRAGASRITALNLVLQDDGHTDPAALALHFETIAQGTLAEGAQLNVDRRACEQQCWSCGARYANNESDALCPHCGALGLPIRCTDEFYLDSIEVE